MVLSHFQAKQLLAARADGQVQPSVSPDLGLTMGHPRLNDKGVSFARARTLSWQEVQEIAHSEKRCFLIPQDGPMREIRIFSGSTGWVRSLYPTASAPTMTVSGIPMHRIKNTDPMSDTRAKIRALGKIKGRVLDTATGLGYTAIEASKEAMQVITVEIDPAAIEVARLNPWSAGLFRSNKIEQHIADISEIIADFSAGHFQGIVHDPPTIQFAGELYSLEFYQQLRRVLARGGTLFHYVGDPKSGQGIKVTEGVIRRLHSAGFAKVERHPDAFGVVAR